MVEIAVKTVRADAGVRCSGAAQDTTTRAGHIVKT